MIILAVDSKGPEERDEHSGRASMKAVGVSGHTWVMEGKRSVGV